MTGTNGPGELLDREFLQIRAQILTLAASLDRLDRALEQNPASNDERLRLIQSSVALLSQAGPGRAEAVQLHFSDPYLPDWRSRLEIPTL